MVRACLLLLFAGGVLAAAPVPVADARGRVDALDRLLGRRKSSDAELIAAIRAVGAALADLAPEGDPKERELFRDHATAALIKALVLEHVDHATKRNERHEVQLAAACALRHIDADKADLVMRALELHILKDRPYEVDPSFCDAVLDPLVRLRAKGTLEWLLEEVVNGDTDTESRDWALAGLDAVLRLPATGEQRLKAMARIISIYQSYMFHVEDDLLEIAGFRGTAPAYRGMQAAGPYWESMRPTVMRAVRQLSIDPRTGLPPLEERTNRELGTLERYQAWFSGNNGGEPPFRDAERPEPRPREAMSPTRMLPPAWDALGAPWQASWLASRVVLDRSLPAAAWRDELREKTLPSVATAALADSSAPVRAAAAVTLARVAAPDAATLLRERVERDAVEEVREAAMLGLLLLDDAGQRDFLRARAGDPAENPRLRAYAILALGLLKDGTAVRAALGPGDLGACAVRALGLAGASAAEISDLLADKKQPPELRAEAGAALLDAGDPAVVPQVLAVFKEPVTKETPVAATAAAIAAGLAAPDDEKTMRKLVRAMGDTDEKFGGVRTLLAASFVRIGGASGAEALAEEWKKLRSNTLRVAERGHFLLALARTGADPAKEILRKEIESLDHDWDLGACALGLALAGERTASLKLRTLLAERSDTYAPHGMMALAILADPGGPVAVRDILKRRRSDDILAEGALALAMLDGEKALPDLWALWERARRPEHYDAFAWAFRLAASPAAIEPLRAIAEGKGDPVPRAFALLALGRMADPAATLHRLARGWNPYGRSPTLLDLARWRDAAPLLD